MGKLGAVSVSENHDSEHDFDDQHEVNGRKSCSVLVILTDPDDFRVKNHDFSARGTNCLKRVIEAVQNVKITFFRQLPRANRFFFFSIFRDIFVIFVGSPSMFFRKITILNTIFTISTM